MRRQERMDKRIFGMIRLLLEHGYGQHEIAELTKSGQKYSFTISETAAMLFNEKQKAKVEKKK